MFGSADLHFDVHALVCVSTCVCLSMYVFLCVCMCVCVLVRSREGGRIVVEIPSDYFFLQSVTVYLSPLSWKYLLLEQELLELEELEGENPLFQEEANGEGNATDEGAGVDGVGREGQVRTTELTMTPPRRCFIS